MRNKDNRLDKIERRLGAYDQSDQNGQHLVFVSPGEPPPTDGTPYIVFFLPNMSKDEVDAEIPLESEEPQRKT